MLIHISPTFIPHIPHLSHIDELGIPLLAGLFLGVLISLLAYQARALSGSGATAAALSGGLVFGLGGLNWALLLLLFFVSSSGLSRTFARRKAGLSEKFSKGSRRDWGQVLANGGLGALLALAHGLWPDQAWPWVAFVGAMASVNADTWATELGVLNPHPPRLLTTLKVVERGTSGGISPLGSLAALAGAMVVAGCAEMLSPGGPGIFAAATVGGMVGSFFDSWLGAVVQAIYLCPTCQKETECHPQHSCGTPTILRRGWRWMDNDVINFGASLAGALAALGIWMLR